MAEKRKLPESHQISEDPPRFIREIVLICQFPSFFREPRRFPTFLLQSLLLCAWSVQQNWPRRSQCSGAGEAHLVGP